MLTYFAVLIRELLEYRSEIKVITLEANKIPCLFYVFINCPAGVIIHITQYIISYHIIALFRSYRYVSMYISMLQLNRLLLLIKIANCKSYLDGFLVAIAFVGHLHFSVIT